MVWCVLALSAACSSSRMTAAADTTSNVETQIAGPLRMDVRDFPAQMGILWALPSITPSAGKVVVANTRYGSLCEWTLAGDARIEGNKIDLHVGYTQRFTSCVAQVRAVQYTATITVPAGTYDVTVIHHESAEADTLRKQTVVVP